MVRTVLGKGVRTLHPLALLKPQVLEEAGVAFILLLPLLWTLAVAFAYAFGRAVYFSFTDYDLFKTPEWVGLRNYTQLFKDYRFILAFIHTLTYAGIVTTFQTALALLLAVVVNRKIRGMTFFRASYYVPSISSSIVITLIFMWLVHRKGMVNFALTAIHQYHRHILLFLALVVILQAIQVLWERRHRLPAHPLDPVLLLISLLGATLGVVVASWTGLLGVAQVSPVEISWLTTERKFLGIPLPFLSIMALNIWTTVPTFMVIFLAGLQDVPRELYEVAELDGATYWQKLWYVTIPAIKPVMFLVVTLGLIGTLQVFDQIAITAGVAPLNSVITLAYYVYWNFFGSGTLPKVGLASAAALFLALLTLVVVLLQRRFGISEKGWYS